LITSFAVAVLFAEPAGLVVVVVELWG